MAEHTYTQTSVVTAWIIRKGMETARALTVVNVVAMPASKRVAVVVGADVPINTF